jgi:hypothetical protein
LISDKAKTPGSEALPVASHKYHNLFSIIENLGIFVQNTVLNQSKNKRNGLQNQR